MVIISGNIRLKASILWKAMALATYIYLLFIQTSANLAADCNCQNKCEQSTGSFHQAGLNHRALLGHSFKNFTLSTSFKCHEKCFDEKCMCQAYQMWQNRCELLDEDKFSVPGAFVYREGYTYFDMNRKYVSQVSEKNKALCLVEPCSNQCCNQNPCAHGGKCTELREDAKQKFNCTCTAEYFGRYCQERRARSCKEQLQRNEGSQSGVYQLFDQTTKAIYEVFCDFNSDDGSVWTLIESFTLSNKEDFKDKDFKENYPVNQNAFTWKKFRLSLSRMEIIALRSTQVRATCNFGKDGLNYTDYLRAALSDIDPIRRLFYTTCHRFEYINIRGYGCNNCTAYFYQSRKHHPHVDSYYSTYIDNCQLKTPGAVSSSSREDDFGNYRTFNPVHRCSSSNDSTTQWWLGEQ